MLAMIEQYKEAWDELTAPGAQFATTTVEVRGVPIKVFESALPSMRSVWEMARGYGDRDYVVYEPGDVRLKAAGDQYGKAVPFTLNPASFPPQANLLLDNDGDSIATAKL